MLLAFQRYYGTALPLPFYVKTRGLNTQDASYVAYFAIEKAKNVSQIAFTALPFLYVALHDRSRPVLLLLATALIFGAYHYFATIETMGYYSRFYLPGFVAVVAAAAVAYRRYQQRRHLWLTLVLYAGYVGAFIWLKQVDNTHPIAQKLIAAMYLPSLVATGILLIAPARWVAASAAATGLCLCIGTALNYPLDSLSIDTDEAILLHQIRRRTVFRGIEQLRKRLDPKVVYHTDMGAPGLLFPEAKVVDLDGLLNEDVTLRGARFEELCEADQPEAIYLPKAGYVQLRADMLASACFQNYEPVTPADGARLHIRKDLLARYLGP
jgi:4-amino-4-deoxy-L-arabinose transferase-like glycosyltransferase